MQRYNVSNVQQFVQSPDLLSITDWQFSYDVVEEYFHTHAFGHDRQLSTDRTVTHDTQLLATDLVRVNRRLAPAAAMTFGVFRRDTAHQHDDFCQ